MTTENNQNENTKDNVVNLEDPKVQEAIHKLVEQQVADKTSGLVAKRDELLEEAKKAKAQLRDIRDKYGDDFGEKFEALKAEEQKRKEADMTETERLEARFNQEKKQLTDMWSQKEMTFKKQMETKDSAIQKYLVDAQLESAISEAGGRSLFLKPALANQLQVVEEAGDYKVRVLDNGVTRLNIDGSPMGISDLVESYKRDEAWGAAFNATGATGGGAAGNTQATNSSAASLDRSKMSDVEKTKYISEKGMQAYLDLPMTQ